MYLLTYLTNNICGLVYKKDGRWSCMEFALEKELMMIGRLLIAGLCGGGIGHETGGNRRVSGPIR